MLVQPDKAWPLQLLSVACLALAAKMEERKVPLLLDLQVIESRFLFKPKTVQRMELLVMASLKWRLRTITPFDFVHLFISKLLCSASTWGDLSYIVSLVSDVIIRTCLGINTGLYSLAISFSCCSLIRIEVLLKVRIKKQYRLQSKTLILIEK